MVKLNLPPFNRYNILYPQISECPCSWRPPPRDSAAAARPAARVSRPGAALPRRRLPPAPLRPAAASARARRGAAGGAGERGGGARAGVRGQEVHGQLLHVPLRPVDRGQAHRARGLRHAALQGGHNIKLIIVTIRSHA